MEAPDGDEAKRFASVWIRRLERSLLSQYEDNSSEQPIRHFDSVSFSLSHDDNETSFVDIKTGPEKRGQFYSDLPYLSSGISNDKLKESKCNIPPNSFDEYCPPEDRKSPAKSPRTIVSDHRVIKGGSPRVDLELVRQKRLKHFQLTNKSSSLERDNGTSECERTHLERVPGLSSNVDVPENMPYSTGALEYPNSFDDIKSFSPTDFGPLENKDHEDDHLRLELWGLRDAVENGQVDLKPYLNCFTRHNQKSYHGKGGLEPSHVESINDFTIMSSLDLDRNSNKYNQYNMQSEIKHHNNGLQFRSNSPEKSDTSPDPSDAIKIPTTPHKTVSPCPQIYGALYNGFETSDSEGSIIPSKKNGSKEGWSSRQQETSPKKSPNSGKGKEKILHELTQYLNSDRKVVKNKSRNVKSPQNSEDLENLSSHPDENSAPLLFHVVTPNTTPRVTCKETGDRTEKEETKRHIARNNERAKYLIPDLAINQQSIMAKVCPKCKEINSQAANWCIECGTALIRTKPSFLSQEQQESYEEQCREARDLISAGLNKKYSPVNGDGPKQVSSNGAKPLSSEISELIEKVNATTDITYDSYDCNQLSNYKRRWHKSSIAWSSFEKRQLQKPSSLQQSKKKDDPAGGSHGKNRSTSFSGEKKKRPKSAQKKSSRQRTTSATYGPTVQAKEGERPQSASRLSGRNKDEYQRERKKRPYSTENIGKVGSKGYGEALEKNYQEIKEQGNPFKSPLKKSIPAIPPLDLNDIDSYDRILTLIRYQSEPIPYLCLPDEIVLKIFSSLSHKDLATCALVCQQFYRIAMDETLWGSITLIKKEIKSDEWLEEIGKRHPTSLTISHCRGNCVTANGLRSLFRNCCDTLEEVDFSGCSGGELIGESILLHISARCTSVVSVDVSWTNVSDNGVQALVENIIQLECLCLNGCQAVTDKSLRSIADRHGESLRIFEVFGCFNITPGGFKMLAGKCCHLQTLNLGQCHKMTDSALGSLVSHLPELENLDLRGCKQIRDSAVKKIVRHCPLLKCLALANCPRITDVTLAEIATNLPDIRSLDICGCSKVSDVGVRALARCCNKMESLDLSSTGEAVTHKSVTSLANYCSQSLQTLKLSFCADITDETVLHLARQCRKLSLLHLYGCKRVRNLQGLRAANPLLSVER
ncbi:predicted protein [Nematostella vectensis]|uniref:F-box domain-containing protein n=1 Tax=Nematostella vectensis TaxID=45351 RepID=A7SMF7_NEMVE|nr:uncharacterized protein LOC5506485 [Nematostella vectensis]EDO35101.1 predicted protein [Nematostella vectensis]|eukprot:XP_001627201.1 predicted protein [Nematostella vectensis]